jgi:hypothetical protein
MFSLLHRIKRQEMYLKQLILPNLHIYLFNPKPSTTGRYISYLPLNLKSKHFYYLPSKIDRQIIFFKLSHFFAVCSSLFLLFVFTKRPSKHYHELGVYDIEQFFSMIYVITGVARLFICGPNLHNYFHLG